MKVLEVVISGKFWEYKSYRTWGVHIVGSGHYTCLTIFVLIGYLVHLYFSVFFIYRCLLKSQLLRNLKMLLFVKCFPIPCVTFYPNNQVWAFFSLNLYCILSVFLLLNGQVLLVIKMICECVLSSLFKIETLQSNRLRLSSFYPIAD